MEPIVCRPWRTGFRTASVAAALLTAAFLSAAPPAKAQIPDEFKDLQVLPADISKRELVGIMRGFASALGVRCAHCHVGPDNLQGMDFATNEKEPKRVARAMLRMTREINEKLLPASGREELTPVECKTCHRGLTDPRSLADMLRDEVAESGVDAAIARYRELRDEYYGSGSYDFSPRTLNGVAEDLGRQEGQLDAAIRLMQLNVELHPEAAYSHILLGQLFAAQGDREAAAKSIQLAIELEPDNQFAKRMLERVQKTD